jgi:hypothetical protein
MTTPRSVWDTVYHLTTAPWANGTITIQLEDGSISTEGFFPPDGLDVPIASDGTFETELWPNTEGLEGTRYRCILPGHRSYKFSVPPGGRVRLTDLIIAGHPGTPVEQDLLISLVDAHNEDPEAHPDIRAAIEALSGGADIATHNADETAHPSILTLIESLQTELATLTARVDLLENPPEPPLSYALRDLFTTDATPLMTGVAEPGPGQRVVTDTRGVLRTVDGALRYQGIGGTGVLTTYPYGNVGMRWAGQERQAGRALVGLVTLSDRHDRITFGWSASAGAADKRAEGYHWSHEDGGLYASRPGMRQIIDVTMSQIGPDQYLIVALLHSSGATVLLSSAGSKTGHGVTDPRGVPQYPDALVLDVSRSGNDATLYPNIQFSDEMSYPLGHVIQDVRVVDLEDAWTNDYGLAQSYDLFSGSGALQVPWTVRAGTWSQSGGALTLTGNAGFNRVSRPGLADGRFVFTVEIPSSGLPFFGCMIREVDANNYLRLFNDGTNTIKLHAFIGGNLVGQILGGAYTWELGETYEITVLTQGNKYQIFINGERFTGGGWVTDVNNWCVNGTGYGPYVLDNGHQANYHDVACYPHVITLPDAIGEGATPVIRTAGATLYQTDFTAADGTSLADLGWTLGSGTTATVQSNRAQLSGSGQLLAVRDVGQRNVEINMRVICPPVVAGYIFAGPILWYTDANNWCAVRMAQDIVGQPLNPEIEVMRRINGSEVVVGKFQSAIPEYTANSAHDLRVQVGPDPNAPETDLLQVWWNNDLVITRRISAELPRSTTFGIHRPSVDDGCVVDSWSVAALTAG